MGSKANLALLDNVGIAGLRCLRAYQPKADDKGVSLDAIREYLGRNAFGNVAPEGLVTHLVSRGLVRWCHTGDKDTWGARLTEEGAQLLKELDTM